MGIDCKGLNTVIHFGPPVDVDDYFQESGRVERDGSYSNAILVTYPGCLKSVHFDKKVKEYCKNTQMCRRKLLIDVYGCQFSPITPKHRCCDICEKDCDCDDINCRTKLSYFIEKYVPIDAVLSFLTNEEKNVLRSKWKNIQDNVLANEKGAISPSLSCGFSTQCINQIIEIASESFALENLLETAILDTSLFPAIKSAIVETIQDSKLINTYNNNSDYDNNNNNDEDDDDEDDDDGGDNDDDGGGDDDDGDDDNSGGDDDDSGDDDDDNIDTDTIINTTSD